jgi:FAD/FMN-containing dehydrogenase
MACVALAATAVILLPAIFLTAVWWNDPAVELPAPPAGRNDVSGLSPSVPAEVVPVASDPAEAERQVVALVARAAAEGRRIAIAGSRHSMGGHTVFPEAIVVDMTPFRSLTVDPSRRIVCAGAGARWSDVLPAIDRVGLSVGQMQSNNDFTVGGSVSVNAHGWPYGSPPIASTVESFRLVTADGRVLRCSRGENAELFALALGGYGLFGVILDVDLRLVANEFYAARSRIVSSRDFARSYAGLAGDDVGLAYGRLSVARGSILEQAVLVSFVRTTIPREVRDTLVPSEPGSLKRLVLRGGVGSDYGKDLRWTLEKLVGEQHGGPFSRNQILNEPSSWFSNRDPASTEVLQEYFVPKERFAEFVDGARAVLLRHPTDLLNVTVRDLEPDRDTVLRYARASMFSLVFLFHQRRTEDADRATAACERDLIEVALACGGTYYLPYRPHATREQFARAYPMARAFMEAKLRHDAHETFSNEFYRRYGPGGLDTLTRPEENGRTQEGRR